jgi:type VI protein secretion system component Hcp
MATDMFLKLDGVTGEANALITVRKAGEKPLEYVKVKMEKVFISNINTGAAIIRTA